MSGNTGDMAPAGTSHAVAWTGLLLSCRFWFGRSRGGAQELAFLTNLDVLVYGPHSEYSSLRNITLFFFSFQWNSAYTKGKLKLFECFSCLHFWRGLKVWASDLGSHCSFQVTRRGLEFALHPWGARFSHLWADFSHLCLIQAKP